MGISLTDMEEINFVKEVISLAGTGSGLLVLTVLWKLGFFSKNGNGSSSVSSNGSKSDHQLLDYRVKQTEDSLAKLAETANHNFTKLTEDFAEHNKQDAVHFERIHSSLKNLTDLISKK